MGLQPPSKIVCVGRNYVDHAAELNNPVPTRPLLFMKPPSSITRLPEVRIPTDQANASTRLNWQFISVFHCAKRRLSKP